MRWRESSSLSDKRRGRSEKGAEHPNPSRLTILASPRRIHHNQRRPRQINDVENNHDIAEVLRDRRWRHQLNRPPKQERSRENEVFDQLDRSESSERLHEQECKSRQQQR